MAKIYAEGKPEKHPELGEIRVTVEGGEVEINRLICERRYDGSWEKSKGTRDLLINDMRKGPLYPLCAEPATMLCAYFVLLEWFGEASSAWVEEPTHVELEGEIELMESDPNVVY